MKQYTLRILVVMAMLHVSMAVMAYDFYDDGIYYNIVSREDRTVEVTDGKNCRGDIVIPPKVTIEGITYNVIAIGKWAFEGCTGLTTIEFPESLREIGSTAFVGCSGLTSIEFPESLTEIGNEAFRYCSGLTTIELPKGLTEIGNAVFVGCSGLTTVELPEGLTKIGDWAFEFCGGLTTIEFPEGLTKIGKGAFGACDGLTSIVFPEGLTKIGDRAFEACYGLTSIVFPESLTEISYMAFSGCDGLTTIEFSEGLTKIGEEAFYGCYGLTSIEFPEGLTKIGDEAFEACYSLTSIVFPESLAEIGSNAFEGSRIPSVCCKSIFPPNASQYAFGAEVLWGTLYVPIGSKDKYMTVAPWRNFWAIEEADYSGVGEVTDSDEVLVIAEGNSITVSGENIGSIEVYSVNGQCVYSGKETVIDGLAKGVYIVRVGGKTKKVIL